MRLFGGSEFPVNVRRQVALALPSAGDTIYVAVNGAFEFATVDSFAEQSFRVYRDVISVGRLFIMPIHHTHILKTLFLQQAVHCLVIWVLRSWLSLSLYGLLRLKYGIILKSDDETVCSPELNVLLLQCR